MNEHDIAEQAYKNGYAKGKADALKWIPVTERLPENGEEVLTYRASGMNVENRFNKNWCFDEFHDYPVTHWMPLPEPPKGE